MSQPYRVIGFVVIVILYLVIGFMAAAGTIFIVRRFLAGKAEQIFYAMFLIMIAAFYLAFAAYFGVAAWPAEAAAVAVFVAIGLLGARLPMVLAAGYALHGFWDLVHELQLHVPFLDLRQLTRTPLAYGFC